MTELNLSDFFQTKAQSIDFVSKVDKLTQQVFEVNFDLSKTLPKYFTIEQRDKFIKLCRDQEIDIQNPSQLKEFFLKIKETVLNAKVLNLTIAYELSDEALKHIVSWLLMTLKKQMVLEIKIDQNLIGGAAVNYNGKYYDFSIRNKVEQILLNELFEPEKRRLQEKGIPIPGGSQ